MKTKEKEVKSKYSARNFLIHYNILIDKIIMYKNLMYRDLHLLSQFQYCQVFVGWLDGGWLVGCV